MIGEKLEKAGWRQGSLVRTHDIGVLLKQSSFHNDENPIVIVASHSCDIAHNSLENDPYIELSIARKISSSNGNYTFNKNVRVLHTTVLVRTETPEIYVELFVELKAYDKISIDKSLLVDLTPDPGRFLINKELDCYVSWLSYRYVRPALPTAFNDKIASADPKGKRKKKAKLLNQHLSGIYVEISPDAEILDDQIYRVNLLGLVPADFNGSIKSIESVLEEYAEIMRDVDMNVSVAVKRESEVSLATIKRFKRFYYDDLSLKGNTPLPPDTQTGI